MPSLPTDNLYKFLTTLGVAIFIFSFWTIGESVKHAGAAIKTSSIMYEQWQQNSQHWDKVLTKMEADQKQLSERIQIAENNENLTQHDVELISSDLQMVNRNLERARQFRSASIDSIVEMQKQYRVEGELIEIASQTYKLYWTACITGLFMTIIGFGLWYRRHQRYQDKIVRMKASHHL